MKVFDPVVAMVDIPIVFLTSICDEEDTIPFGNVTCPEDDTNPLGIPINELQYVLLYGSEFQLREPLPILNNPVSSSTPISALANTGFAVVHSEAVPFLN